VESVQRSRGAARLWESGMDFDIPWRRIATGAGVLLFHVFLIYLLAIALHLTVPVPIQVREIVFNLMQPNSSRTRVQDLHIPTPKFIIPRESESSAITLLPELNKELQQPSNGNNAPVDLGGVGRYLYNCSGMFYEQLNAHDRAGCLLNRWDPIPGSSPLLGVAKQSPYDEELAKRHAPDAAGTQHTCDQTSINANLGLPCYNFANH
jgi:hypothetical protein